MLVTVATAPLHGLFYVDGSYSVSGGIPSINAEVGPLYWANIACACVIMGTGMALVIRQALRTRRLFRRQALLLVGLVIADDDPGVHDDITVGAFEPGTSGADGTGLGLAIVRAVAEAHGRTVALDDDDASDARFVVSGVETGRVGASGGTAWDDTDGPTDTAIRND